MKPQASPNSHPSAYTRIYQALIKGGLPALATSGLLAELITETRTDLAAGLRDLATKKYPVDGTKTYGDQRRNRARHGATLTAAEWVASTSSAPSAAPATPEQSTAPAVPPWRTAQQLAMNAVWTASAQTALAPYCVSLSRTERHSDVFVGALHYENADAVTEFAAAYDVTPTEDHQRGGMQCTHKAVATVDGVQVTAWAVVTVASPAVTGVGR
ncbi:hypothetical protein ACIOHE_15900 [Streptomyces sp. NPDC087851]|uniref:hypothetical protein n=1 Tax=Streptomyces sp. NPDC087851 TaxID=3365810 RepID=UPI0038154F16